MKTAPAMDEQSDEIVGTAGIWKTAHAKGQAE
jgi:hypothetical protein